GSERVTVTRATLGSVGPRSIINAVAKTRTRVLLDDASSASALSAGDDVRARRPRSLLCLPIASQGKTVGVLYLESDLATHAFTPARVALLEVLASQAAISLENARLYADQA